ncbi:nucleotidyltransferase domain-containing protein [Candidatus Woesearchaeota archaeon]|nr:nucleotidyltransferase domain-containing protein [Candidatus Woesearchaeota archaeon]
MRSKENKLLDLFFNEPTKQWHFEELVKTAKINRKQVLLWLRKFTKENLIKKIKQKSKMPYYLADYGNVNYKNKKTIYSINVLYKSGFLNHIASLPKAKTVILFGSTTRWDWHAKSDVDLFVYGNPEGLQLGKYELKLGRDIQLFLCQEKKDFSNYTTGLIKNIMNGQLIKGNLDFIEVQIK